MPRQGELWMASLDPVKGSEQSGHRPVLIVSGDLLNQNLSVRWVVPLTTKMPGYAGNPQLEPNDGNGLSQPSEVLVLHLRSMDRSRLIQRLGCVEPEVVRRVHETVGKILRY
jgi:mRNA interferase MazF